MSTRKGIRAFLYLAITVTLVSCDAPGKGSSPSVNAPPSPVQASAVDAVINARGLRANREIDYTKPKGRMRIVCVGGAATFGDGVPGDATYEAWMQKNMRGRGYDVEVLNAGKAGFGAAEAAERIENELLKYQPDLVVVSIQGGEGNTSAADLQKIQSMLQERKIVYVLLAVPDFPAIDGYQPRPPAVYVVPSKAALDVFANKHALVDTNGHWTAFAHQKMGNALAELIVGAPLMCCAAGPVPQNP
jgi:hypothetical protein